MWLRGTRPDIEILNDEKFATKIIAGEKYEITLKSLTKHKYQIHYMGLFAYAV